MRNPRPTLLGLGLCLLVAVSARAQDFRPRVQLRPGTIGLEEMAVLEIEIHGPETRGLHFDAGFELENLRVRSGPSQTMSVQIVNGVPSTSRTLTWHLQPLGIGRGRVHSIILEVGQERLRLEDESVEIQQEIPESRRRRADPFGSLFGGDPFEELFNRRRQARRPTAEPKVFLRAEATPRRPWVGQQVLYTLFLYTQTDIGSVQPVSLPDFKGFWVKEIPQPESFEQEAVEHEGERITRVVLLQRALFPLRAGSFEIEPVETRMVATMGRGRGLFGRQQEISRTSNGLGVEVLPLPEAPAGWSGAVGRLDLAAELAPLGVEIGNATTLTLTLEGEGHLQGIEAPRLPEVPGLRSFPPQQRSSEKIRRRKVRGSRTWSFVLIPERAGELEVPPVEIPYFDPARGSWQVARAEVPPLVVTGTPGLPRPAGETLSLHPIRTAALPAVGGGAGVGGAAAPSRWRPWLFGTPWVLALGLLLARRRGLGGPRSEARRALRTRLERAAGVERPREAAAAIEEAWREFLAARWQIPAGAASPTWGKLLEERGTPEAAARELVKLADDLHYLRYAPKLSSTDEMRRELLERSRRLIRALG